VRTFTDGQQERWIATARHEDTPRHHGRWYLVFHPEGEPDLMYPMSEVRWQTQQSAERTIRTMSEFELRRRLKSVLARFGERRDGNPPNPRTARTPSPAPSKEPAT
jgi:hypothetical protein